MDSIEGPSALARRFGAAAGRDGDGDAAEDALAVETHRHYCHASLFTTDDGGHGTQATSLAADVAFVCDPDTDLADGIARRHYRESQALCDLPRAVPRDPPPPSFPFAAWRGGGGGGTPVAHLLPPAAHILSPRLSFTDLAELQDVEAAAVRRIAGIGRALAAATVGGGPMGATPRAMFGYRTDDRLWPVLARAEPLPADDAAA